MKRKRKNTLESVKINAGKRLPRSRPCSVPQLPVAGRRPDTRSVSATPEVRVRTTPARATESGCEARPKPRLTAGPPHSCNCRGRFGSRAGVIGFPWALVLEIPSGRSSKHGFLSPFSLHYGKPPRGSCIDPSEELALNQNQNKRKKIQTVALCCSVSVSWRLPHESCRTAQTQKRESQWRPSRSSGNSRGRSSRRRCR